MICNPITSRQKIARTAAAAAAVLVALLLAAPARAAAPLTVFVGIAPQKYFVQRIGGQRVDVAVMVAPGASPATYEPKPRQMAALAEARVYFAIGVPFETAWLDKIAAANAGLQVVHTEAGIEKMPMTAHHDEKGGSPGTPSSGETVDGPGRNDHAHDPGVLDPHIWTSPPLVKIQAAHIRDALIGADPDGRKVYEAGFAAFGAEIDAIDAELRQVFKDHQGMRFMVFHPAWGYFARTYGLAQIPIEIEGKEPKPARLAGLIEAARATGIKVIFVQPQFSDTAAQTVARAISGRVVHADPLAEDWGANLRRQAARFREALR